MTKDLETKVKILLKEAGFRSDDKPDFVLTAPYQFGFSPKPIFDLKIKLQPLGSREEELENVYEQLVVYHKSVIQEAKNRLNELESEFFREKSNLEYSVKKTKQVLSEIGDDWI